MRILTQEEYRKMAGKRHKYGVADAADRTYEGIVFDSKREMEIYQALKDLLRVGMLYRIDRQVRCPITLHDKHVCTVVVDFKVVTCDGAVEYIEVKGFETELWRLKKKLLLAMYPGLNLRVVK